jgi:catalase
MADALVFELSKVESPAIRTRMVSHLLNIDIPEDKATSSIIITQDIPNADEASGD